MELPKRENGLIRGQKSEVSPILIALPPLL
jgi:hypothetical protein